MLQWSEILRDAFSRFLPGALVLIAIVLGAEFSRGVRFTPAAAQVLSIEVLGLSAGYAKLNAAAKLRRV